jgi:DNA-binding IscR family transcriptional regulator
MAGESAHQIWAEDLAALAEAIKIQPNYLYRVLPKLAADGQIKRDGKGWHPASS